MKMAKRNKQIVRDVIQIYMMQAFFTHGIGICHHPLIIGAGHMGLMAVCDPGNLFTHAGTIIFVEPVVTIVPDIDMVAVSPLKMAQVPPVTQNPQVFSTST